MPGYFLNPTQETVRYKNRKNAEEQDQDAEILISSSCEDNRDSKEEEKSFPQLKICFYPTSIFIALLIFFVTLGTLCYSTNILQSSLKGSCVPLQQVNEVIIAYETTDFKSCLDNKTCHAFLDVIEQKHDGLKYNFVIGQRGELYIGGGFKCLVNSDENVLHVKLLGSEKLEPNDEYLKMCFRLSEIIDHGILCDKISPDYSIQDGKKICSISESGKNKSYHVHDPEHEMKLIHGDFEWTTCGTVLSSTVNMKKGKVITLESLPKNSCSPLQLVDKITVDIEESPRFRCFDHSSCLQEYEEHHEGLKYNFIISYNLDIYVGLGFKCKADSASNNTLRIKVLQKPESSYMTPYKFFQFGKYLDILEEGFDCGKVSERFSVIVNCNIINKLNHIGVCRKDYEIYNNIELIKLNNRKIFGYSNTVKSTISTEDGRHIVSEWSRFELCDRERSQDTTTLVPEPTANIDTTTMAVSIDTTTTLMSEPTASIDTTTTLVPEPTANIDTTTIAVSIDTTTTLMSEPTASIDTTTTLVPEPTANIDTTTMAVSIDTTTTLMSEPTASIDPTTTLMSEPTASIDTTTDHTIITSNTSCIPFKQVYDVRLIIEETDYLCSKNGTCPSLLDTIEREHDGLKFNFVIGPGGELYIGAGFKCVVNSEENALYVKLLINEVSLEEERLAVCSRVSEIIQHGILCEKISQNFNYIISGIIFGELSMKTKMGKGPYVHMVCLDLKDELYKNRSNHLHDPDYKTRTLIPENFKWTFCGDFLNRTNMEKDRVITLESLPKKSCSPLQLVDEITVDIVETSPFDCSDDESCLHSFEEHHDGLNYNFIIGHHRDVYVGLGFNCKAENISDHILKIKVLNPPEENYIPFVVLDEHYKFAQIIYEGLACGRISEEYSVKANCNIAYHTQSSFCADRYKYFDNKLVSVYGKTNDKYYNISFEHGRGVVPRTFSYKCHREHHPDTSTFESDSMTEQPSTSSELHSSESYINPDLLEYDSYIDDYY